LIWQCKSIGIDSGLANQVISVQITFFLSLFPVYAIFGMRRLESMECKGSNNVADKSKSRNS